MKAIIIGAGIGGITTGIALEQIGIETEIYEASTSIEVAGAGIWMASNAMQVFGRLGIAEDVLKAGTALDRLSVTDHLLNNIQETDQREYRDHFGYAITSIHRARLRDVLIQHYPREIFLGKKVQSVEQGSAYASATFEDQTSAQGDILIGADGIHSMVRRSIFPSSKIRYSGQTCWRGVANMSLADQLGNCCIEAWGKKYRFGLSVISPQEVYWFAVAKAPKGERDLPEVRKSKLSNMYEAFAPPIPEILESTPESTIIRNDISDLALLPSWHKGRICLIGDAGHATTPNMGQGGGQAVEDAWFLSQVLKETTNPAVAFGAFFQKRKQKVRHVVKTSWRIGKMAHIPFGQGLRNTMMRLTPPKQFRKLMMDLYSIDY